MSRQPRRNKTNFKYLYLPPSLPMLQAAPASSTADRRQPVPPSQQAKLVEYAQLPHGVMRIPRPLPHMVRRWEASPTMMASHDAWSYCGRCIRSATRKHSYIYIYIHMNIYLVFEQILWVFLSRFFCNVSFTFLVRFFHVFFACSSRRFFNVSNVSCTFLLVVSATISFIYDQMCRLC